MRLIEKLATTPYGTDPEVDAILDQAVVLFNLDPEPGRPGRRHPGQRQRLRPEPRLPDPVAVGDEGLGVDHAGVAGARLLDLHGYVTPTLVEATTKPHNPIDYDLWLKWNQSADRRRTRRPWTTFGLGVTRPINDWCSERRPRRRSTGICPDGRPPGPAVAEGWDDWGPFYTPMYAQHVGLNGSTVEMCNSTGTGLLCPAPALTGTAGRLGARIVQETVVWSSLLFDLENRNELLHDELERYRRGVDERAPAAVLRAAVRRRQQLDGGVPDGLRRPDGRGPAERARGEPPGRLAARQRHPGPRAQAGLCLRRHDLPSQGSYVVLHGPGRTAGSPTRRWASAPTSRRDISILYAPPAAGATAISGAPTWSGCRRGRRSRRARTGSSRPVTCSAASSRGRRTRYALEIDSPTAVRTLNALMEAGLTASSRWRRSPPPDGATLPTGSAIFAADAATKVRLASSERQRRVVPPRGYVVSADRADRPLPRILVLTGALNQDVWSLQNLGFTPVFMSTASAQRCARRPAARLRRHLEHGRLAVGRQRDGAGAAAGVLRRRWRLHRGRRQWCQFPHQRLLGQRADGGGVLTGDGHSGIVHWENVGGAASPITGASPSQDTAIMDPPTWFTSVPATMSVDGRFPTDPTAILGSGLWPVEDLSPTAPGSAVIAHGTTPRAPRGRRSSR